MHSYRHYDEEQRQEAKLCVDHDSVNQPNAKTQRRRATEQQTLTERAIRRPLK